MNLLNPGICRMLTVTPSSSVLPSCRARSSVYLQFRGIIFLSVPSNLGILALIMIQSLEKIESVTNVSDFSSIRNSVTIFIKDCCLTETTCS